MKIEKLDDVDEINPLVFSFEGKECLPRSSKDDFLKNTDSLSKFTINQISSIN